MLDRPTLNVRRSDLPGWVFWNCGEVYLDGARVAFLVGGKRRSITVSPGRKLLAVRLDTLLWGSRNVEQVVFAENGESLQYRCGVAPRSRAKAWLGALLNWATLCSACWFGQAFAPLLRPHVLELCGRLYQTGLFLDPQSFPLCYRLIGHMFSVPVGGILGGLAFLNVTRKWHLSLESVSTCFLEPEHHQENEIGVPTILKSSEPNTLCTAADR
jgi:hypothetical protein